ncbi:MAG: TolC family outer membrane protein, partial [Gammaproteobacteria bacterium]
MPSLRSLLVLAAVAFASTAQIAGAEGLLAAYRDAADSDPQLQQAASNRLAQRETKPQARALSLPNIGASAELDHNYLQHPLPGQDSTFFSRSIGISLNQPIFNQGNRVRLRQADSIITQAEADFLNAQQTLIVRVANRYFGVLSALEDLTFARADKEAIARQLEQAKQRFAVGLITITDVQEAQARFDSATSQEIQAANNVSNSREALREVTGKEYKQLKTLSARMPLTPPKPTNPEVWVKRALDNNPVIQSAAQGAETARYNIDLQKAGHYPTLDLNARFSDDDDNIGQGRSSSRSGVIGLSLNVPIYQGGAVNSRVREAAYRHESAKEFLEEQQRSIIRQVRDAYRGVETAIGQVKALDQARVSA